ncbi:MAG: serine hydrolase [Pseudomonadota bacterium]
MSIADVQRKNISRIGRFFLFIQILTSAVAAPLSAEPPRTSLAAALPTEAELDRQRRENSMALHAKLLCSGVFISGRTPEDMIAQDLQWSEYHFHDWAETKWTVNREGQRVTLWRDGGATHTAVHHPSLGCSLLPEGAERVAFEPVSVRSALPPASEQAWPTGDRNAIGDSADAEKMRAMLDFAFDDRRQSPAQNTRALIVLHKGKIVAERYAPGFSKDMPLTGWSMGKSIAAALVGIFVKETGLNIDAPAPVRQWRQAGDPRGAITTRHLLHMAGGLKFHNPNVSSTLYYTDFHDHESVYFKGRNTEALVLNQPLAHTPGAVFQYRNTNTLSLMSILKNAQKEKGDHHLTWPHRKLFDKIGARSFVLEPDAYGNFVITGNDYATARDWARLGLLFLQDGNWEGERLWPKGWLRTISAPSPADARYGGHVWRNEGLYENAPDDAIMFRGWLNQTVMIVPSRDVVIVRLGYSDAGGFDPYFDQVVGRALDAIK